MVIVVIVTINMCLLLTLKVVWWSSVERARVACNTGRDSLD